jgi:hypothetical protein
VCIAVGKPQALKGCTALIADSSLGGIQKEFFAPSAIVVVAFRRRHRAPGRGGAQRTRGSAASGGWCGARLFKGHALVGIAVVCASTIKTRRAGSGAFGIVKAAQLLQLGWGDLAPLFIEVARIDFDALLGNAFALKFLQQALLHGGTKFLQQVLLDGVTISRKRVGAIHIQTQSTQGIITSRRNHDSLVGKKVTALKDTRDAYNIVGVVFIVVQFSITTPRNTD